MLSTRPTTVFVSGHLDLKWEEFEEHYAPLLREAADRGCSFVVGDAPGCDYQAQRFLKDECKVPKDRVTVYHMLEYPRHSYGSGYGTNDPNTREVLRSRPATARGGYPLCGGFKSDEERDAAMTLASDADIAWVRPSGSKRHGSGTKNNLERRARLQREAALTARKQFPRFRVEHDWLEIPIIRLEPVTLEELAGDSRERERSVPLPPELHQRWLAAQEACNLADAEWERCKSEVLLWECRQENEPV